MMLIIIMTFYLKVHVQVQTAVYFDLVSPSVNAHARSIVHTKYYVHMYMYFMRSHFYMHTYVHVFYLCCYA